MCSSGNMNLKPFLSLLFFEHRYRSYYKSFRPEIISVCSEFPDEGGVSQNLI